jgi:hypothetical protein
LGNHGETFAGCPSPFWLPTKNFASDDEDVWESAARWHMFEKKREAVMAIEAAVLPLMPK